MRNPEAIYFGFQFNLSVLFGPDALLRIILRKSPKIMSHVNLDQFISLSGKYHLQEELQSRNVKYVVVYTCRVHFCSAGIRGHSFMLETMDIYLYFVVSVLENKRFSFQTLNSSSQAFGVARHAPMCVCT
ncbi:hypothetical protein VPH35_065776 [Triticum aestivum]|uniref:Uncharacterized protein n=1 Tax=Triticum turgidum subsp. durum TaxID=4567 RepID=A0A9R0S9W4_TRITD|nr:unnamed protein product [Triticum turgidum subsp. durum]